MAYVRPLGRLKEGVDSWNKWRKKEKTQKEREPIDLSSQDFSGQNLEGIDLSECLLGGASFEGANLNGANLSRARAVKPHASFKFQTEFAPVNFDGVSFDNANLTKTSLRECSFRGASMEKVNLREAGIASSDFNGARVVSADLSNADCSQIDAAGAKFEHTDFGKCNLRRAQITGCTLVNCTFSRAFLDRCSFEGSTIENTSFAEVEAVGVNFTSAKLEGFDFRNVRFQQLNLSDAILRRANFSGLDVRKFEFGANPDFTNAIVKGCKVDRFQLESMQGYGGLTVGQRMSMRIDDGVATLRASYSGFLQWIHLFSLVMFLFPYVWFVMANWGRAKFLTEYSESHIYLVEALARFIFNGGENWEQGYDYHWSFLIFIWMFIYNILRGVLLWKTKQLELLQDASGLPMTFSLKYVTVWQFVRLFIRSTDEQLRGRLQIQYETTRENMWGILYRFANVTFILTLLVALLNTFHFFTQKIPITV